jgi:transposase-like protein
MRLYPDDEACLVSLWRERYSPDGEHAYCPSPSCKRERTFKRYTTSQQRQSWTCTSCGNHLHPTAGTIFHKSSTPLNHWFYVMYLMTSTRCGISAKQVERELGCAYKTAARMMRQIRTLMDETDDVPLEGEVEVDETYVGGKARAWPKRPKAWHDARKSPVVAMVERDGKARAVVTPMMGGVSGPEVTSILLENVKPGSRLYTDEARIYHRAGALYDRQTTNHAKREYALGTNHIQTVEGFFSTVKLGLSGVFHGVSRQWLQSYLNEYVFRYNHRAGIDPFHVLVALSARPATDPA